MPQLNLPNFTLDSNLTKCFVTKELMRWPGIEALYGKFLQKTPVFSQEKRWEDLHTRVIEHVSPFDYFSEYIGIHIYLPLRIFASSLNTIRESRLFACLVCWI